MLHSLCAVPIRLTHAGDDTVHRQPGEPVVDGLGHSPGISSRAAPRRLPVAPDKCRVLLFGDVDVEARVRGPHDVAGAGVQQDVGGVQSAYADQTHSIPEVAETRSAQSSAGQCVCDLMSWLFHIYDSLLVGMKGGKGETLALVFPEEFTLLQADVVHLVGGAAAVRSVPLVC